MLGEIVHVGDGRLLGEVIELEGRTATLQVYEDTAGLAAGVPVFATGRPFEIELGPGLLGGVFDGLQRPLLRLAQIEGDFLQQGQHVTALDRDRLWPFVPTVQSGDRVGGGAVLGTVQETTRHHASRAGAAARLRIGAATWSNPGRGASPTSWPRS